MCMPKKACTTVALFSIGLIGVVAGGPQRMAKKTRVGVDGSLVENCNGNGTNNNTCPAKVNGVDCLEGFYDTIKDELPGTTLKSRYNNDNRVCTLNDDACKKYTLKQVEYSGTGKCKQVQTPIDP